MDFFSDAENLVRGHLARNGVTHPAAAELEELLGLAINLRLKSVDVKPRSTHRSQVFNAKLAGLDAGLVQPAEEIIAKAERGESLAGHLSRASLNASREDGLLIDWGLHHLHISNHRNNATDPFFARTGPVMFAMFTGDAAYFVDIYNHGPGFPETWTRAQLLEIVWREWPEVLEPFRMRGFAPGGRPIDDPALLAQLRTGGVYHPVAIDGHLFAPPGGGVTTAGSSLTIGEAADMLMIRLRDLETHIANFDQPTRQALALTAGVDEAGLDFELREDSSGDWVVFAKGSNVEQLRLEDPFRA